MPEPAKVLPAMTPQQQISYGEQMVAVIDQRIAENRNADNCCDKNLNDLLDAKVYYIKVIDGGKQRLNGKAYN